MSETSWLHMHVWIVRSGGVCKHVWSLTIAVERRKSSHRSRHPAGRRALRWRTRTFSGGPAVCRTCNSPVAKKVKGQAWIKNEVSLWQAWDISVQQPAPVTASHPFCVLAPAAFNTCCCYPTLLLINGWVSARIIKSLNPAVWVPEVKIILMCVTPPGSMSVHVTLI